MNGKSNDFPVVLDRLSIAEMTDRVLNGEIDTPEFRRFVASGAPYADINTAKMIMMLIKYLEERHVEPGFHIELDVKSE